jgi:hypothetical protein
VLGALDTRHVGDQQCFELAGVEVAPAPLSMVIARASLAAFGAMQLAAAMLDDYFYFVVCQGEVNRGDLPWLLNAKNLGV